jgi:hypothetical protein
MRSLSLKSVSLGIAIAGWMAVGAPLGAQQLGRPTLPPAKIDIVLERYQADKKVSSLPFSLWVTGGVVGVGGTSRGSLRIGVDVPIGSSTQTTGSNNANSTRSDTKSVPEYRNVGTSIDCYLQSPEDGKYDLHVNLNDTSLYDPSADRRAALVARGLTAPGSMRAPDPSAFRTFSFENTMRMRDGQTAEYVNATDKITGEVVKALVTMTLAKQAPGLRP